MKTLSVLFIVSLFVFGASLTWLGAAWLCWLGQIPVPAGLTGLACKSLIVSLIVLMLTGLCFWNDPIRDARTLGTTRGRE